MAQSDFGYNLLPAKNILAEQSAQKPKELDKAIHWKPLSSNPADLISKQGYYPKDLERYYYFDHYLGLNLYKHKRKNQRSFAKIKLKHALIKGHTYKIYLGGFFPYTNSFVESYLREELKLRTEQDFAYNQRLYRIYKARFEKIPLGFAFSKKDPKSWEELKPISRTEVIAAQGFFKFQFEYTATEASEYLTIGNFLNDKEIPEEIRFAVDKYVLIFEASVSESEVENLVPNGSFEEYTREPSYLGQWWQLKDWFSPHPNREHNADLPSPDLMHSGLTRFGVKGPLRGTGSGRVGYINFDTLNFNEGLAVKLKKPLKKGKKYAISFNVGSTNKTTNQFIYRTPTTSDLDSLKVQFGFSKNRPKQGYGTFLTAEQMLQHSQFLNYLFKNKQEILTFTANDDYTYFAFGYFEELDVPQNGQVGVIMDDLFIYEIPDQELQVDKPTLIAATPNPPIDAIQTTKVQGEKPLENLEPNKPTTTTPIARVKPKPPKPKPTKPTIAKLPVTENFYDKRDSTNVKVKFSLNTKEAECKMFVYDHGTEDGDIVTLKLNETILAEHLKIRRRPNVVDFDVTLRSGENFIYPIAENLGRIPPNTIQIVINCKGEEKSYRLFSRPGSSEALRVVLP